MKALYTLKYRGLFVIILIILLTAALFILSTKGSISNYLMI